MAQVITNGYGLLTVNDIQSKVGNGKDKVISVNTGADPADLTRYETFQFILLLVEKAGLAGTREEDGTLRLIEPESPKWVKRRDDVSKDHFNVDYNHLKTWEERIVDHIIALEKKLAKQDEKEGGK